MTREQLMDGYCFLYEEAYASKRAMDRLERYWRSYRKKGSGWLDHAFVAWRMRRFKNEGSARFQRAVADGWRRLKQPGIHSDIGQLIYYWDSAHFTDYLDRFRSDRYAENVRIFRGEVAPPSAHPALERKQWERDKFAKPGPRLEVLSAGAAAE
jgi:hypothetical protein